MKKLLLLSTLAAATILTGCATHEPTPVPKHTTAVLVGTGYKCDKKELRKKGSDLDIATMHESIRFCYSGTQHYIISESDPYRIDDKEYFFPANPNVISIMTMQDSDATVEAVKTALRIAVQDELAIIYFSCFATQVPTTDPSEPDGFDEAIKLYDGLLLDNDIWDILQTAKGRVFIMFETSHGSSMFRAAKNGPMKESMLVDLMTDIENKPANGPLNMVCWAASMEGEELDDRSIGSKFTNAFYFKLHNRDQPYQDVYDSIYKSLSNKQNINKTVIGEDFSNLSIFR